jgi:hypothetical protein
MLATTMGFVNAGIFDDIEDDIGQVAKDAVHGTEVIAYKAFVVFHNFPHDYAKIGT